MLRVAVSRWEWQLMAKTKFRVNQRGVKLLFDGESHPVQTGLKAKADVVGALCQRLAPRGESGDLARNIVVRRHRGFGTNGWSVAALTHYAYYVHEGTRPHVILPKKQKLLRWENPDGEVVFAARARHPGTRPQPFLLAALGFVFKP